MDYTDQLNELGQSESTMTLEQERQFLAFKAAAQNFVLAAEAANIPVPMFAAALTGFAALTAGATFGMQKGTQLLQNALPLVMLGSLKSADGAAPEALLATILAGGDELEA